MREIIDQIEDMLERAEPVTEPSHPAGQDPLTNFIYLLIRDQLGWGAVEETVHRARMPQTLDHEAALRYAEKLARLLRPR